MKKMVLRGNNLTSVLGPCVYVLFDDKGRPLYVGRSRHGLSRVFSRNCGDEGKTKAFKYASEVRIEFFRYYNSASDRERHLIRELRPVYNTTGNPDKRRTPLRPSSFNLKIIMDELKHGIVVPHGSRNSKAKDFALDSGTEFL